MEVEVDAGDANTTMTAGAGGEEKDEELEGGASSPSVEAFNIAVALTPSATEAETGAQASDGGLASCAVAEEGGAVETAIVGVVRSGVEMYLERGILFALVVRRRVWLGDIGLG